MAKGRFFTSRKGIEAAFRSLLIVMAGTDIHKSILMQTALTDAIRRKIYSFYSKKEVYHT